MVGWLVKIECEQTKYKDHLLIWNYIDMLVKIYFEDS